MPLPFLALLVMLLQRLFRISIGRLDATLLSRLAQLLYGSHGCSFDAIVSIALISGPLASLFCVFKSLTIFRYLSVHDLVVMVTVRYIFLAVGVLIGLRLLKVRSTSRVPLGGFERLLEMNIATLLLIFSGQSRVRIPSRFGFGVFIPAIKRLVATLAVRDGKILNRRRYISGSV